ncbi:MAG: UDP-3-O-(3-hydroxymyristoyl)glucosamine N-acyltransferase [Bacteroidetes bacterium]|nr:MAG: UDP-3-O-(3-hydroxymyristoyl)glucosamine N-acyltransferase [Bacteroidota bacterium]
MKIPTPLTLKAAAEEIGCHFVGSPEHLIEGFNEIHVVEPGDATFVDHPKYYEKALNSRATTIIINTDEVACPEGKALLVSTDPFRDFTYFLKKYRPFIPATAQVSTSASIGEGTIIQPGTFIGNHVTIGKNCIIHANVSIYDYTVIGDNTVIHAGAVLGADAYYFQKKEGRYRKLTSGGRVVIGDDVEIGAMCTIDKGVSADTTIGEGTKFDNHVQVGHDTTIGKHCLIGAYTAIAGVTTIEDDVLIWARVSVNKDLTIKKGAVVLATSSVHKSLEGGREYYGRPAKEKGAAWREIAILRKIASEYNKPQ